MYLFSTSYPTSANSGKQAQSAYLWTVTPEVAGSSPVTRAIKTMAWFGFSPNSTFPKSTAYLLSLVSFVDRARLSLVHRGAGN